MPHRPDLPCARCGTLMWRGSSSLPEGQAVCRPCRREQPQPFGARTLFPRPCVTCSQPFKPRYKDQRACSNKCRIRIALPGACDECGALTDRGCSQAGRFCDGCARSRTLARWSRKGAARRGAAISGALPRLGVIAKRDGWRCHLCRRKVNPKLRAPHRRSATLDHLVPVSHGGTHDAANLALAHWSCNSSRGVGGQVQLALVG